jgi:hypothetical protein
MKDKFFWFDCDFNQVHHSGHAWLEAVVGNISQHFGCEPVRARHPADVDGAKEWADVYRVHQPTADSIFLMHGRTSGVQDALESLWEVAQRQPETLPRCRVVYSGGSEWSHLEQTPFTGSRESYCRVKPNSFKWNTAQFRPEHEVSKHFAQIIENFIKESKSARTRLNDFLFFLAEQVFETSIGVAGAIIRNEGGDDTCAEVLDACWEVSDAAGALIADWPDDESPEHARLREIRDVAVEGIYKKYEDPNSILDYEELFRALFRGGPGTRSLYQVIEEGLPKR